MDNTAYEWKDVNERKIVFILQIPATIASDEIYSHKTDNTKQVLGGFRPINPAVAQADPILLIELFVFRRLFKAATKASCLKKQEIIFFIYTQTAVGIWQQDSRYQCPW